MTESKERSWGILNAVNGANLLIDGGLLWHVKHAAALRSMGMFHLVVVVAILASFVSWAFAYYSGECTEERRFAFEVLAGGNMIFAAFTTWTAILYSLFPPSPWWNFLTLVLFIVSEVTGIRWVRAIKSRRAIEEQFADQMRNFGRMDRLSARLQKLLTEKKVWDREHLGSVRAMMPELIAEVYRLGKGQGKDSRGELFVRLGDDLSVILPRMIEVSGMEQEKDGAARSLEDVKRVLELQLAVMKAIYEFYSSRVAETSETSGEGEQGNSG